MKSFDVGPARPASPTVISRPQPVLSRLLSRAEVTPVSLDGAEYELMTWTLAGSGERTHWLCPAAVLAPEAGLYPAHRDLLRIFGGVGERGPDEPDTWLMSCDDALTARIATQTAREPLSAYEWILEGRPGGWPIELDAYYAICEEANGNTTYCHRVTGEVVLFAPDHAFDHVEELEGCPPYSLYRIPAAPTFTDWVEEIARQWLAALGPARPGRPG